jgi:hypothetical protein
MTENKGKSQHNDTPPNQVQLILSGKQCHGAAGT